MLVLFVKPVAVWDKAVLIGQILEKLKFLLFLLELSRSEFQNQRLTNDWLSSTLAGQYPIVSICMHFMYVYKYRYINI